MTTDFSAASIPALYREVFDECTDDGAFVIPEIYECLLGQFHLSSSQSENIRNLAGNAKGQSISRTNLYKTLALVAWLQQGKQLSDKLFENCTNKEYPCPQIPDLKQIRNLKLKFSKKSNLSEGFNYATIAQLDIINIHLVPEKKGIFLKYSEYIVTSKRFNSKVTRRYNDFVALKDLLLNRFPYRLVPSLPPKKIVSDAHFLESRRRALHRWLTLVSRHPVISQDAMVQFFLTDQGPDCQYRIKDLFKRVPDEFMTSDIAATAKQLLPKDYGQLAANSQNVRSLVNVIGKLKHLTEKNVERQSYSGQDFEEFALQLKTLANVGVEQNHASLQHWPEMQRGFAIVSKEMTLLSSKFSHHAMTEQNSVCERLGLLLDILVAHKELCERLEKGLHHDHDVALAKLLSLKKRKMQGVIRGTDAESVEHLEAKMLTQENVITNMELRSDFSLYCVHRETQLVYSYLGTLSYVMKCLLDLKINSHSELLEAWRKIQLSAQGCFVDGSRNGWEGK